MNQHEATVTDGEELQKFIAEAITLVGGVRALAAIAGVSERTVYAWKNGERFPSRTNLNRLSEHLEHISAKGYSPSAPQPHWRGLRERMPRAYGSGGDDNERLAEEFVFIDKAEARPSAGGGSLETSDRAEARFAFRLDWVLQKTHSSEGLRVMEVTGRSMENTLHNGDLVLVNERDRNLVEDRVYVVRVHEEIYVKRFARTPGRYHFRGDNRELSYQDIEIDPRDEGIDWEVVGRVLWAGKEL